MLVVAVTLFVTMGWLVVPSMGGDRYMGGGRYMGKPPRAKQTPVIQRTIDRLSHRVNAIESSLEAINNSLVILGNQCFALPDPPPDLVPVPIEGVFDPELAFCRQDGNFDLFVRVKNQGGSPAAASTVRVLFDTADSQFIEAGTPALDPGEMTDVLIGQLPGNCSPGVESCQFKIFVDDSSPGVVAESNEDNNNVQGECTRLL